MTREFIANINRKIFTATVSEIQEYEGNNVIVVNTIKSKIKHSKELYLYDTFINICKEYKIDFKCYEISDQNLSSFKVVIRQNNHDYYSLLYKDKDKDISSDLAHKLYRILAVQIKNEIFIKSAKK